MCIKPGDNVLYFPCLEDEDILRLSDDQGCDATVIELSGDRVNLLVTDFFGNKHFRHFVEILHKGQTPSTLDFCVLSHKDILV